MKEFSADRARAALWGTTASRTGMARRLITMVVVGIALPIVTTMGGLPKSVFASTSMHISWSLDQANLYTVGIDKVSATGGSPGYAQVYEYPGSTFKNNPVLPNPIPVSSAATLSQVRVEVYQRCHLLRPGNYHDCTSGTYKYSVGEGDTAVAIRITPKASVNLGRIVFPAFGQSNAAQLNATFVSRTPIPEGSIKISMFQLAGQKKTSTGYPIDAFATGTSTGNTFTSGPLWNGRYIAFISDTRNPSAPRAVTAAVSLTGRTSITFDLDAVCFGTDECQSKSALPAVAGEFHPLTPTRIVDTATKVGVAAAVRPGDGRLGDPNPVNRLAERLDHEFRVTGVGGVPRTGVSAVLLNVTAYGGASNGSLVVVPKPPRATSLFDDQGSFGAQPTAASQLWWHKGDTVTSQVLVRVGSGGRVRIVNRSSGITHLRVDVVGWYDESQPGQNGLGLTAVAPVRSFDTRSGIGTTATMIRAGEVRTTSFGQMLPVEAVAAVANVGLAASTRSTALIVWPTGTARPSYASVAAASPQQRSNMVTVRVAPSSAWSMVSPATSAHVNIDLQGYFAPQVGSHGRVVVVNPVRVGSASIAANGAVRIYLRGKPGVPTLATSAVYVNVTVASAPKAGAVSVGATNAVTSTAGLRYVAGHDVSNLVLARVAADGSIVVRNIGAGAGRVSVDLVAVVAA